MTKKVLIVKNITREGPGILEDVLKKEQVPYEIVDLAKNEPFPDPKNYAAVVVLGGPDSANDKTDKMKWELERVRETVDSGIPYFGICLGLQVLVKAAGDEVLKNRVKEIGFRDPDGKFFQVDLTEAGKKDPLFSALKSPFRIFHLHGETVRIGEGMTLLGKGKWCEHQIVKVGKNAYGIQGHLELTPEMFEKWMTEDPDLSKQDKMDLRRDFSDLQRGLTYFATTLFTNFIRDVSLACRPGQARSGSKVSPAVHQ